MAILMAILMAMMAMINGHTRQMLMAILAIIMAIHGNTGNNNGHAMANHNGHIWQ